MVSSEDWVTLGEVILYLVFSLIPVVNVVFAGVALVYLLIQITPKIILFRSKD